jgi:hypothetical protein
MLLCRRYDITADELEIALESLATVYDVKIEFDEDDDTLSTDSTALCSSAGRTILIEFLVSPVPRAAQLGLGRWRAARVGAHRRCPSDSVLPRRRDGYFHLRDASRNERVRRVLGERPLRPRHWPVRVLPGVLKQRRTRESG